MYHNKYEFVKSLHDDITMEQCSTFLTLCIKYEFIFGIYFLLIGKHADGKVYNPIAFELACENYSSEIALFLTTKNLDFNMYIGLSKAAFNGCTQLLKSIQARFKNDKFNLLISGMKEKETEETNKKMGIKEILENGYYLPLFEACRGLQFETMKWLLQLDGLKLSEELKSTILESFTFLDACKTSDSKTLSLFLKLHNYENAISPYVAVFF